LVSEELVSGRGKLLPSGRGGGATQAETGAAAQQAQAALTVRSTRFDYYV
jgi:hypothetical protein